jgi:phenylalanyl-tRNA synthetase beta chain
MRVLLSWLREFAPIEGDPVALGEHLSDLGMAVESIEYPGAGLDGIVVARVLDLRPHPRADRIQLVDVDAGDGEPLQICCGAFNMAVGDLVPLATLGTEMPGGMVIERRKLRGEWSNGMLCSSRELGLGDDHAGILILDTDDAPGTELRSTLGIEADVLYDLEINPNRPDAMSVAGVARDLAARLGVPFRLPEPSVPAAGQGSPSRPASVEILDPDICGRFYTRVLEGVQIGPSPAWIADRLVALGMRPINCVVDASNYVMLELGQPTHTYDLDRLAVGPDGTAGLRVRRGHEGETVETLDGLTRTLGPADAVITDADDVAVGLAGVMGGTSTEISDTTTSVLLELAWWDPMTVARTSKRLNLRSEASARFERGTDPEIAELAARRFAELLGAAGVQLTTDVVDARGDLPGPARVVVRTARVNAMLGTDLTATQIRDLLTPIGFGVETTDADRQLVTVPSFRPDTTTEIDVIEEVARHFGYANIAPTVPPSLLAGRLTPRQIDRRRVRDILVGLGYDEAMPLAFLAPDDLDRAGVAQPSIRLTNPLAAEESVLRPSLRPGLLKSIRYNQSHRQRDVALFEIGKAFGLPAGPGLPDEREILAVVRSDADASAAVEAWTVLRQSLGVDGVTFEQAPVDGLHPGRSGRLLAGEAMLGALGEIDPAVLGALGIVGRVAWLEVDLDALLDQPHGVEAYTPVSRYPSSDIDLAFVVDEDVAAGAVRATIIEAGAPLVRDVRLFDVFRSETLGPQRRSLAFALRLQADDRTLTDDEVAEVRAAVITAVSRAHDGELRG